MADDTVNLHGTVDNVLAWCRQLQLRVTADDVESVDGEPMIDGMNAYEWIYEMVSE